MKARASAGAVLAVALFVPATEARAGASHGTPVVNLALTGSATADTSGEGRAASAVDGDAATAWCPAGPSGTITVDLKRTRALSGFGVTLLGGTPATVRIATATVPGRFRIVRGGARADPGAPVWFAAAGPARWVRLSVTGDAGRTPCVGELRTLARGPVMIVGDDLSFAVQEAAAGAT